MKYSFFIILLSLVSFSCNSQQADNSEFIAKKWFIEFQHDDIGFVRTILNFESGNETFEAHSRKNADRDVLGFWTSSLGRIFTNDFKNGALLHVVKGKYHINNDSTILSGIFTSAFGNYYFNGTIINNELKADLTTKSGKIKGSMKGTLNIPKLPFENYNSIYNEAIQLTSKRIYDTSILDSKEWKEFDQKMLKVSSKIQDDLEMVSAFFYYANKLPFSHYGLMKIPDSNIEEDSNKYEPQVILEEKSAKTAYMKISSFGGTVSEMDSIMQFIKTKNYTNLIVDLRNNPGGSVAAGLTFASNVVDTTFYGGIFLTQKWFNQHQKIPKIEEYAQLPLFSEANFDLIIEGIHKEKGLCLQVIPNKTTYKGNVYILTNNNTASTCEPIVYGLKQYKKAVIVGEKTAGAMLNGEFFKLQSGFSLIIPTATYYTSDGYKIDGNGVNPNIETKQEDALNYVLNNLIK